MSEYYKPVYEFLFFEVPKTFEEIAAELTERRYKNISFRVVSYTLTTDGMTVLTERNLLTEISEREAS